ncbi:hypothetical protein NM688_g194 [Phlebia brevispora]|uniref:Uncharacterized protein n=1 Tax=Phlebia brevispora TaxID=194682 RepID=A0ACC1TFB2_9APHY|nr:hypothetical protein NM688_g194 [Phlebia brevispora]
MLINSSKDEMGRDDCHDLSALIAFIADGRPDASCLRTTTSDCRTAHLGHFPFESEEIFIAPLIDASNTEHSNDIDLLISLLALSSTDAFTSKNPTSEAQITEMRLATSGSVRSNRAHILITDQAEYSIVNVRFANACNLSRTRKCERGIVANICAGPVEVPTTDGWYISTFAMVIQSTVEPFDVILGRDWIALCRPDLSSGHVEPASEDILDSLPFGHRWLPGKRMGPSDTGKNRSSSNTRVMYQESVTVRHPRFYLTDGTIIIRLQDTLYKIHLHFLTSYSELFHSTFSLQPQRPTEGTLDEDPVRIEDVGPNDFDKLLSLFYPLDVIKGDLESFEDWVAVLRVSSRLDFQRHRELAITKLSSFALPADKIQLSKQFDVDQWLGPAYKALCLRDQPLTVDEAYKIGLEDAVKIAAVRDGLAKFGGARSTRAAALFEATLGESWNQ